MTNHTTQIADVDGVPALVRVLASSHPPTTLPAAAALAALASNSPLNRQRMVTAGAVPLLVRALLGVVRGGHGGHPGLGWAPAAALAYAALEPAHKRALGEAGIVPLLARVLRKPADAATPAMCAAVAWFLALHDDFNAEVCVCVDGGCHVRRVVHWDTCLLVYRQCGVLGWCRH